MLNWREIEKMAALAHSELAGQHVEQWVVPERGRFPQGFLKGEWLIRTSGRRKDGVFLFSVRPRHPYFAYRDGKGPRAAQTGTRSPFDLAVSKQIKGRRIHSLEALKRERMIILWFETGEAAKLGLLISLIPATPEALLVEGDPSIRRWKVIARSRSTSLEEETYFSPPEISQAPLEPPIRAEITESGEALWRAIEKDLDQEAFETRVRTAQRELKAVLGKAEDRLRQSEESVARGGAEPDWRTYGDLLKAVLHDPPACVDDARRLPDFRHDGAIRLIPCDSRLSASEQVEKFYSLAKRKARRIAEGESRRDQFSATISRLKHHLADVPFHPDWKSLERLENAAGIRHVAVENVPGKKEPKRAGWLGRSFRSRDGLPIYVGKSSAENLELTFKIARGNDIWMHVRGRPGAHVVIPLPQGKSAPLETLLDGAVLAVYFSGGEEWGKTEVDYTFKKHVKRIKDSTEASYTHNKTLIVEPDSSRIKTLMGTNER